MNKLGKVSNVTNSSDPQMINSRVFVGNLNTFAVTKEDVERLFKRYGRIYGISMHKGYAFVQFCNEYDARNAVAGEEGRVVAGQALDVNMVSEPKPNRPTRKRQAGGSAAGVSDWDFFYDTGYSHAPPRPAQMHGPPMKRARSDALTVRRELVQVRPKGKGGQPAKRQPASLKSSSGPFIQYNVSDVLICGNCKEQFANIEAMTTHRKTRCKLRFACKCQELADKSDTESGPFHCASCKEVLPTLWDAVFHAQNSHNVKVVVEQLKEKKETEEQDNVVPGGEGDGAGNHEGEASGDSHNIEESGDGNDGEGEFENDDGQEFGEAEVEGDGDGGEDDAVLQDDAEGGEGADSAE